MTYIGRFAPSPTGLLHFGSLLAALASYLDARAHQGRWLLRIEDIDPPREHPDARHAIPQTLERFGLHWDGDIVFQSDRHALYQQALTQLAEHQQAYRCSCSRKQLLLRSGSSCYDGHCLTAAPAIDQPAAWRVCTHQAEIQFTDSIQGTQHYRLTDSGDFVIRRKDQLYAYLLAVVVDDADQGVTHVVRGSDLLDETPRQLHLQQLLGYSHPQYSHIPVACNTQGQKLSKQNLARPLDDSKPVPQLRAALRFLGQNPPAALQYASRDELLKWAITHWTPLSIPRCMAQPWRD
ncbi:MAG: tRNA glutamyl-Q(34) synthetase GluQRS [Marinobacterium sp.]|nr:tRNA glutamyl-Q(34) synthetase GluQRS [Marinobacterium sp.]